MDDRGWLPRGAVSANSTTNTQTANTQTINIQNVNLLVSEYCNQNHTYCSPYTPPDIAIIFNKILWANWATSGGFSNAH